MTYLSDNLRNRKRKWKFFVLLAVFVIVCYFWPTIRIKVYPKIEPFIVSYSDSKNIITSFPSHIDDYFTSREALRTRNDALLLTIERLENTLMEKDAIIKEKKLIEDSGAPMPSNTIIMYPIMMDLTNVYSTLVLSKGFKDGVEEKSLIYLRGRQPVCIVAEVSDNTSICKLLSASGNVTEGVTSSSSLMLSLKGNGGGTFVADVLRDTDIKIGDVVYLASDQTMVLGTVSDVIKNNQATSWLVYVRGAYNPVTSSVFYMNK